MTDLTIIIPTRNRLWSLPQALESCRSSILTIQIIVVDDGSSDGTWDWLQQQERITSIRLNGWGKPYAVNVAMAKVDGEFIRFLDSDDWFPEGTLEEQVEIARKETADLVVAGLMECHEGRDAIERPWNCCDDFISQQLGEGDGSHYSAFTFRKAFIEDIPHRSNFPAPKFATRDDRCLMLEVAMRHPKIAVSSTPGLCHRHHGKDRLQRSVGLRCDAANLNLLLIYMKILGDLEERGELTPRRARAAVNVLDPLAEWMSDRQILTSLKLLVGNESLAAFGEYKKSAVSHVVERIIGRRNYFRLRYARRATITLIESFRHDGTNKRYNWIG